MSLSSYSYCTASREKQIRCVYRMKKGCSVMMKTICRCGQMFDRRNSYLWGHHFGIRSTDFDPSIQAGPIMCINDIATEYAAGAHSAVIRSWTLTRLFLLSRLRYKNNVKCRYRHPFSQSVSFRSTDQFDRDNWECTQNAVCWTCLAGLGTHVWANRMGNRQHPAVCILAPCRTMALDRQLVSLYPHKQLDYSSL